MTEAQLLKQALDLIVDYTARIREMASERVDEDPNKYNLGYWDGVDDMQLQINGVLYELGEILSNGA
jgi:hypothetical protein